MSAEPGEYHTPVVSTISGTAHRVANAKGGLEIIVVSDDGRTRIGMAHLSSQDVKEGDRVVAGQTLGKSGQTGHATGPHVHYTLTIDGKKVDPLNPPSGGGSAHPVARGMTLEDAQALAVKHLTDTYPHPTPSMIHDVRAEVTNRYQVHKQSVTDAEDAGVEAAQRWAIANPGKPLSSMPAPIRNGIPAKHYDEMGGFIDRVASGTRDQATSDGTYGYYLANPDELANLSGRQMQSLYGSMDRSSWLQLQNMRGQIVKGAQNGKAAAASGNINMPAFNVAIGQYMGALGLPDNPKPEDKQAAQVGALRRSAFEALTVEQAHRDKPMNDIEVTQFVQRWTLGRTVAVGAGGANRVAQGSVTLKQINPEVRASIEASLTKHGTPVTEENILAMYYAGTFKK
ncbi:peptidoglycan DD-metalloendopeptidase family protein [Sphingomonas oligophenolica]|uniref:M23ase beta-sheet core domain-containing protein n=1 Tax=Sphingomonas oligophenolica TaxID=301154 RepID=A0A502C0P6_9SPHN|nr:peptidoglycan DD-metalloendopeptidase family protein [Sphingomonas oligophenolica]TPG06358.1 hypothetical protein EAH84_14880 [Sphingomonas oligophenolica]